MCFDREPHLYFPFLFSNKKVDHRVIYIYIYIYKYPNNIIIKIQHTSTIINELKYEVKSDEEDYDDGAVMSRGENLT